MLHRITLLQIEKMAKNGVITTKFTIKNYNKKKLI